MKSQRRTVSLSNKLCLAKKGLNFVTEAREEEISTNRQILHEKTFKPKMFTDPNNSVSQVLDLQHKGSEKSYSSNKDKIERRPTLVPKPNVSIHKKKNSHGYNPSLPTPADIRAPLNIFKSQEKGFLNPECVSIPHSSKLRRDELNQSHVIGQLPELQQSSTKKLARVGELILRPNHITSAMAKIPDKNPDKQSMVSGISSFIHGKVMGHHRIPVGIGSDVLEVDAFKIFREFIDDKEMMNTLGNEYLCKKINVLKQKVDEKEKMSIKMRASSALSKSRDMINNSGMTYNERSVSNSNSATRRKMLSQTRLYNDNISMDTFKNQFNPSMSCNKIPKLPQLPGINSDCTVNFPKKVETSIGKELNELFRLKNVKFGHDKIDHKYNELSDGIHAVMKRKKYTEEMEMEDTNIGEIQKVQQKYFDIMEGMVDEQNRMVRKQQKEK